MRSPALLASALALAVSSGCDARGGPRPSAVAPAAVSGDAPAPVEIAGAGFEARVQTDFTRGDGVVEEGFQARLAPSGGGAEIALLAVGLTVRRTLLATVPAGIAHGLYDLVVVDPAGRSGLLAGALRVVTPSDRVAGFQLEPIPAQHAGGSFTVAIAAVDAAGALVDGFEGEVALADATGTLAPERAGPFVAGRLRAPVVVRALATGDALVVTDAAGHAGRSPPFDVTAGPPQALAVVTPPLASRAGACSGPVEVALRDGLDLAAAAEADLAVALETAPPRALDLFLDPACAQPTGGTLALATGSGGGALWVRASAAGTVTLRARAEPLLSAAQDEVFAP